ncbi:hypothetical protein [Vulcanisaeta distributa]|uniref:hypothetical protein n=1 Tax=Vulcanisaeta distributa TaxID=164451 RepID=UPI0006D2B23E|nr:hypothetical protein [Vulcanisaeta distributa]
MHVVIPNECPDLRLELLIKYGNNQYVIPLSGSSEDVNIPDAIISSQVQVELLGNGSLLYSRIITINNSNPEELVINPHIVNFAPTDLLNNELPNAILNIGDLYYVGPGKYCVPINSSIGMVIYGNDIYVVNITSGNVNVRVWTLGALGIKSLLIIFGLLTLLLIIVLMIKGLSNGGSNDDDYIVIE